VSKKQQIQPVVEASEQEEENSQSMVYKPAPATEKVEVQDKPVQ
jgi:hypothetical protein